MDERQKRFEVKFTATREELRRIKRLQSAAGYKTRSRYVRNAALSPGLANVAAVEDMLGDVSLRLARLERSGLLSAFEQRKLNDALLRSLGEFRSALWRLQEARR